VALSLLGAAILISVQHIFLCFSGSLHMHRRIVWMTIHLALIVMGARAGLSAVRRMISGFWKSDGPAFDRAMNAILDSRVFVEAVDFGHHDDVRSLWQQFIKSSADRKMTTSDHRAHGLTLWHLSCPETTVGFQRNSARTRAGI